MTGPDEPASRRLRPNEQSEEVRAATRRMADFVARVSHEMRTPLHAILGLVELGLDLDLDERSRELATGVRIAGETLLGMVDDLLDLMHLEAGALVIEHEACSMRELLDEVVILVRPGAEAKGLTVRAEVADDVPGRLVTDRRRVRQVVLNLAGNAVKFTQHGSVALSASMRPGGLLHLQVADTGAGIAESDQTRVFEAFERGSSDDVAGAGLGLAIVSEVVELLGGSVAVTSTLGAGSVFSVTLPVRLGPAPEEPGDDGAHEAQGGEHVVLVVEDNAVNRMLITRQLDRLGVEHRVATNGFEALEVLSTERPDLVLMDWQMPGIDGLETTRRLRAAEREHDRHRIPVVAVTASAMSGDRERCFEAGMDDFLPKPVGLGDLDGVLRRWLAPSDAGDAGAGGPAVEDGGPDSTLERLLSELGDLDVVVLVLETFLRDLGARLEVLRSGSPGEVSEVSEVAHSLKSSAALVGLTDLAGLCARIERDPGDEEARRAISDAAEAGSGHLQRWLDLNGAGTGAERS